MDFLIEIAKVLAGAALFAWVLLWFAGMFEDNDDNDMGDAAW